MWHIVGHNAVEYLEVGEPDKTSENIESGVALVYSLQAPKKRSTLEQRHRTTTKQEDVAERSQAEGLIGQVSSQKLVRA